MDNALTDKQGHTVGPWYADADGREIYIKDDEGFPIQIAEVVDGGDCASDEQLRADQLLIAAAPDMLAALIDIGDTLGTAESNASGNPEWEYVSKRVSAARAAIAKATGAA